MTKGGKLIEGIFEGETINTPSMLCVEDYIDALEWAQGDRRPRRPASREPMPTPRSSTTGSRKTPWIAILAEDPATALEHLVCLVIADPDVVALAVPRRRRPSPRASPRALDKEGVALDIGAYRDAPPGLRIWCGATVEPPISKR